MMKRIISPSMLSADFGNLARDTRMIDQSNAEWIHIDVMDGVFVPNISFGFPVLEAINKESDKFMDVHLMIVEPEKYIERFVKSGADLITVHYEATGDIIGALRTIRALGVRSGVSIKPGTDVNVLEELLPHADLVLIMSVEPGFGGQSFITGSIDKIKELRQMIDRKGTSTIIEVDGGITAANAAELFAAGAEALVAGSAVFKAPDPAAEIDKMLNAK